MSGGILGLLLFAIFIPLLVNEAGDLAPSLARRLLRWGARRIGQADQAERYEEEWLADLERVPGNLTKFMYACGVVVRSVPRLRTQFRQRPRRARRPEVLPGRAKDSSWAIAGGAAVLLGSLLPFVSSSDPAIAVTPAATGASALFGLIMVSLGIALRAVQRRFLRGISLAALCLSALGTLSYAAFIVVGLAGVATEQDPFGDSVRITFSPGIGIFLTLAGCATAAVADIRSIQHCRT